MQDDPSALGTCQIMGNLEEVPGYGVAQPWLLQHLENKPADCKIPFSLSPSVTLPFRKISKYVSFIKGGILMNFKDISGKG